MRRRVLWSLVGLGALVVVGCSSSALLGPPLEDTFVPIPSAGTGSPSPGTAADLGVTYYEDLSTGQEDLRGRTPVYDLAGYTADL